MIYLFTCVLIKAETWIDFQHYPCISDLQFNLNILAYMICDWFLCLAFSLYKISSIYIAALCFIVFPCILINYIGSECLVWGRSIGSECCHLLIRLDLIIWELNVLLFLLMRFGWGSRWISTLMFCLCFHFQNIWDMGGYLRWSWLLWMHLFNVNPYIYIYIYIYIYNSAPSVLYSLIVKSSAQRYL